MKATVIIILTIFVLSILTSFGHSDVKPTKQTSGKELFKKMCSSCHAVNTTKSAPPFQGIRKVRGSEWVYKFMKNPAYMMQKDEMSRRMLKKFGQIMPAYFLTNAQIDEICNYVDSFPYNPNSKDYDYRRK